MKLNIEELLDFFDNKKDDIRHHISSVIGVVGEDLGAALFKHYYEKTSGKKVTISLLPVLGEIKPGTKKGPRLDRWIYIEQSKSKFTAYQAEIKNWSAYAIGARKVGTNPRTIPAIGFLNWQDRTKFLKDKDKNRENKVFYLMKKPVGFPINTISEPLIIYWCVLSEDGKNLNPFFQSFFSKTKSATFKFYYALSFSRSIIPKDKKSSSFKA